MENQIVPEIDVLIGIAKWLNSSEWRIEVLSIPHGRGIDSNLAKMKLKTELTKAEIDIRNIKFIPSGEDIIAKKENNTWKIECKGLSGGKSQTIKNNFDRAVSSTISYYNQVDRLRLGLALPEGYNKFLREKLPKTLRIAINLWVFVWVSHDDILVFAPDEEIHLETVT